MGDHFVSDLLDYSNTLAWYVVESAVQLKEFLNSLAFQNPEETIVNKLLSYGYDRSATEVRTREEWERRGLRITVPDKIIYQLVMNKDSPLGYDVREVYDVGSTDGVYFRPKGYPDAGAFAERLIRYPPCPLVFPTETKIGKSKAEYVPEKQVIELTSGMRDEKEACHYLLREYAHFFLCGHMPDHYERAKHAVEALAVSYAVAIRFSFEPPVMKNIQLAEGLDVADVMKILEGLSFGIRELSEQIEHGPELKRKAEEKQRKQQAEKSHPEVKETASEVKIREFPTPPKIGRE